MSQSLQKILENDGVQIIDGREFMADAQGRLVPLGSVSGKDKLIDQSVRKIIGYGYPLSEQIRRYKDHTFADIAALKELIFEQYGANIGGPKGNIINMSFNGCLKVTLQIADYISFGMELQAAKSLIDECMNEWASETRDELKTLVLSAFEVDSQQQVKPSKILPLLRFNFEDDRWIRAMQAIRDSMRVVSSKAYIRLYWRDDPAGDWQPIPINIAAV